MARNRGLSDALVRGMRRNDLLQIPDIAAPENTISGSYEEFGVGDYGGNRIVLGARLAASLGVEAGDGVTFEARFIAERAGDYLVRVWPGETSAQRAAKPNTHAFTVTVPDFETRNPTLAGDELRALAVASGGQYFALGQADQLPSALTVGLVDNELIHSDEVWNAPLLILIFLTAIIAEWIIRKRARLV